MPKAKVRRALARCRSQPKGVQRGMPKPSRSKRRSSSSAVRPAEVVASGAVQGLEGLDGRQQGVVAGRQQVGPHVGHARLGPVGVGQRGGRRVQPAVAVGVQERLVAVAEVARLVAALAEDGRPEVPPGHEAGVEHEPGQGGGAGRVLPADRVQPGQLGGVADGEPEAAQVADVADREAAA
jgi:hypothetical protein